MLTMLVYSISMMGGTLKVTSGKTDFLKSEGTVAVIWNWDKATYADKESLKSAWGETYDKHLTDGEKFFLNGFNEVSKKLKATQSADGAKYTMTITVTNIDYFFSAMSVVPGHKHAIWATIDVKDASGNSVCTIKAERFKGGRDFVKYDSYTELMGNLGKKIADL